MKCERAAISCAAAVAVAAVAAPAEAQLHGGNEHLEARLIADADAIVPGRPVTLGLHLKMTEGWHTYWENPGDSGLPFEVDWDLPEGFRVTDLQWPVPLRLEEPGEIEVYAFKDEVLLLARVFPPREISDETVTLGAAASWLVCEKICLPGSADLSLELKVASEARPDNEELFARFREKLPASYRAGPNAPFEIDWTSSAGGLTLTIDGAAGRHFDFYPLPEGDLVVGHPKVETREEEGKTVIEIPVRGAEPPLERLDGVVAELDRPDGKPIRGWRLGRGRLN